MEAVKNDKDDMAQKYLSQLDDKQKKAFEIAKNHLKTSFNIQKSNGFKIWLKR
jgi:hypothetical protein